MEAANNFAVCLIRYFSLKSRHFHCQGPYKGHQPRLFNHGLRLTKPKKNLELGVNDICYLRIYGFQKQLSMT